MTGHESSSDLYAVLGVPRDAPQTLIDHAYRAAVRRNHPDTRAAADAAQAVIADTTLRHRDGRIPRARQR